LARKKKWDCIQTRVKLGKGEYKVVVDGSGVNILLDGDVKAVEAFVDKDKFMTMLSLELGIETKTEDEVCRLLGAV
jgi:carbamate kinase